MTKKKVQAKKYIGIRDEEDRKCHVVVKIGKTSRDLPWGTEVMNHSPLGFEWGYGGSGPAQLALAILLDFLGNKEDALRYYQQFKFRVIAKLLNDQWELTGEQVQSAVDSIKSVEVQASL